MRNLLKQIQSDSSPLILAIILALLSGLAFFFLNIQFELNYAFGIIAIVISIYVYFNDRKIYRFFFPLILILGLLKYLSFSLFQFNFSIGNPQWISINPIFIILLILQVSFSSKKMR